MMNFNRTTPCDECPFRADRKPTVRSIAAENISIALLGGRSFSCVHDLWASDANYDEAETEHCAGAMIMLEMYSKPNDMMRIGERLGLYKYEKLNMKAPVFNSFGDFVLACEDYNWSSDEWEETAEYMNDYLERGGRRTVVVRKAKADPPIAQGGKVA